MTSDGFSCTLRPDEARRRAPDLEELSARLLDVRPGPREAVLRFRSGSDVLLQRFVDEETACCTFFDFTIGSDADGPSLRVGVPAGAEPLLSDLLATLRSASFDPRPGERPVGVADPGTSTSSRSGSGLG